MIRTSGISPAINRITILFLIILNSLLVLAGIASLSWRFQLDAPIMLYIANLMDRLGYVPYRQIFDMNMPGTYFAYYFIVKLFGYTDIALRFADLIILTLILVFNWLWMKNISKRVAWCGSILWGLLYLGFGQEMSLQREYLILLPIIMGIYIYSTKSDKKPILKNIAIGFSFSVAANIKPPAAIGLLLIVFIDLFEQKRFCNNKISWLSNFIKRTVFPIFAGFSIPFIIIFFYLWANNAIAPFLDIVFHYWPLYTQLSGDHITISGIPRISYLISNYLAFGHNWAWFLPFSIGLYIALYQVKLEGTPKKQVIFLIGLVFCYSLYPIISGQFWNYHWLLFLFFIVQASSLCLIQQPVSSGAIRKLFPVITLMAFIIVLLEVISIITFSAPLAGQPLPLPKNGRVDEMSTFLKRNLLPGDTVQPLDWTGGAVHAMLISNARIATPFIYDFYFYQNISNPYIQGLRNRFITDIKAAKPRFIIQIFAEDKPWVLGTDTTREFGELQAILSDYAVVSKGNGYLIYEQPHLKGQ
jgi:hypothetical protein